jgi:hypothetical protein
MASSKQALQKEVKALTQERDVLFEKCKQSEQAYAVLMYQFKEMLRHRFGQKSERYVDAENPQLSLYDDKVDDDVSAPVPDSNVVDIRPISAVKKCLRHLLITCREQRSLSLLPSTTKPVRAAVRKR